MEGETVLEIDSLEAGAEDGANSTAVILVGSGLASPTGTNLSRWQAACTRSYVNDSEAARVIFMDSGSVECTWCNAAFSVVNIKNGTSQAGNYGKHEKILTHVAALTVYETKEAAASLAAKGLGDGMAETRSATDARHAQDQKLRALTTALAVALGVAPSALRKVYEDDMGEALHLLHTRNPILHLGGSPHSINSDLEAARQLLVQAIKDEFAAHPGMFGALASDGATRRYGERQHYTILDFLSSELAAPIVLAILLPAAVDDDGKPLSYDHIACARDIMKILDEFGINKDEMITSLMGDNVTFNTALARTLGLMRGKCLGHSCALVAEFALRIPGFETILDSGKLVFYGGGAKRAAKLKALGLMPSKMVYYCDRFTSGLDTAAYLNDNFTTARDFYCFDESVHPPVKAKKPSKASTPHPPAAGAIAASSSSSSSSSSASGGGGGSTSGIKRAVDAAAASSLTISSQSGNATKSKRAQISSSAAIEEPAAYMAVGGSLSASMSLSSASFAGEGAPALVEDAEDEDVFGTTAVKLDGGIKARVKAVFERDGGVFARTSIAINLILFNDIPDLVKATSADSHKVKANITSRFEQLYGILDNAAQPTLSSASNPNGTNGVLTQAIAMVNRDLSAAGIPPLTSAQEASLQREFQDKIVEVATLARRKYDEHIQPALNDLRRRFLYTIDCELPPMSFSDMRSGDMEPTADYFGVDEAEFGPKFRYQWEAYTKAWNTLPHATRSATISSAYWRSVEEKWPLLSRTARWWLEFESSSICCERHIAQTRDIDSPLRQSMKGDTFKREVFFRCNRWLLEKLLKESLDIYQSQHEAAATTLAGEGGGGSSDSSSGGGGGSSKPSSGGGGGSFSSCSSSKS